MYPRFGWICVPAQVPRSPAGLCENPGGGCRGEAEDGSLQLLHNPVHPPRTLTKSSFHILRVQAEYSFVLTGYDKSNYNNKYQDIEIGDRDKDRVRVRLRVMVMIIQSIISKAQ